MENLLSGIRVLDFGRYVAGPYCATLLGFMGAEVIRIERPGGGEDRFIAPFGDLATGGLFMQTGCNKQSLELDFRHPLAREVIDRLVKTADVVIANLPPAALKRLGLDWDQVSSINPRVILASQTAFGTQGPLAESGGFDGVAQAMSGAMYMTGTPGEPTKAAAPYVDYSTAVLSAFGVMAALRERDVSGMGQHVESSLLHTAMAVFGSHLAEEGALGLGRPPTGNRVQTSGPSDVFATRDGHVLTHVVGNGLFKRCAKLLDREDWLDREDLASDQGRGNARDELCDAMGSWCSVRETETALAELRAAGIPAGEVLDLAQAVAHPQVAASGIFREVGCAGLEEAVRVVDLPLKFSRGEAGISQPPPELGRDSREILASLGFAGEELEDLVRD